MKAYQYEIESRLIKMLMCLCVVLSFAGCNSDEEIEGDPYAGGKEPYGIRFLVDAPSPDRAYPGELVTYKVNGSISKENRILVFLFPMKKQK